MAEPFLPHGTRNDESTPAAEPGQGGPAPEAPEEPDVIPGEDPTGTGVQLAGRSEPAFRTPTPGDRLHPEDLVERGEA